MTNPGAWDLTAETPPPACGNGSDGSPGAPRERPTGYL
jgi:hypothetical protein